LRILITGGMGFIGANLIRLILAERPGWRVVNLDLLTYAANPANLASIAEGGAYRFVRGDVAEPAVVDALAAAERFDAVIHCAAETHVDRSIDAPADFLRTNVQGTLVLLEAARRLGARFLQMGTDEVYGTLALDDAPVAESAPVAPRSPYSASKAAADHMVLAFHHTHGLDAVVTRASNNYGPYQNPEKLVPLMLAAALEGRRLPVYGDGRQRRDWIHVEDHCRGVLAALERGRAGEVYNLGGGADRENLEVIRRILALTGGAPESVDFVADRPGHDRRYAIDHRKATAELGWRPLRSFDEGLAQTVAWYRSHPEWWRDDARAAYDDATRRIAGWASLRQLAP
jgi:dTDP-glucose 4,6-dehydratase